jgi:hypothetical protein
MVRYGAELVFSSEASNITGEAAPVAMHLCGGWWLCCAVGSGGSCAVCSGGLQLVSGGVLGS